MNPELKKTSGIHWYSFVALYHHPGRDEKDAIERLQRYKENDVMGNMLQNWAGWCCPPTLDETTHKYGVPNNGIADYEQTPFAQILAGIQRSILDLLWILFFCLLSKLSVLYPYQLEKDILTDALMHNCVIEMSDLLLAKPHVMALDYYLLI